MLCITSVYRQADFHLNGSMHISHYFFKNGSKNLVNNYRLISLLNSVSKILERLVFDKVYPIVNPLISPNQHGFMRKRSVQSQLISNHDIIGNDLDKGVQNDIIFLDFSKAFDKVPHNLLLHKLKTFGFNNKHLSWFTEEAKLLLLKANSLKTSM